MIITDQGSAIVKAVETVHPKMYHQLCTWHMFRNILSKVCSTRRGLASALSEEKQLNAVKAAIWAWIKCDDIEAVGGTFDKLMDVLLPAERSYVQSYWCPKSAQVLHVHTNKFRNLGAHSTQRNEGMHPAIKAFLNPKLNLDEAIRLLTRHFHTLDDDINAAEHQSRLKRHHGLHLDPSGNNSFSILEGHVTLHCINLIKHEWMAAFQPSFTPSDDDCYSCPITLQYGLPCVHWLYPYASLQETIPLSPIHPRWHLDTNAWDPRGEWTMTHNSDLPSTDPSAAVSLPQPEHRGIHRFVSSAYGK